MPNFIDLSRLYYTGMPEASGHRKFELKHYKNEKTGSNLSFIEFTSHTGTHIDAPSHYLENGTTIDKIPLETFTGEGFVINIVKEEYEAIEESELAQLTNNYNKVKFLFIRTGWEERWGELEYESHHPFLSEGAAEFLIGKIKFLGIDTISPDPSLVSGLRKGSPVHRILLSHNIFIIENLANLSSVINKRLRIFAFPLNIKGCDGSPARVVATISRQSRGDGF